MLLIKCKINLMLTQFANCVIFEADRATTFPIAETKLYIGVWAIQLLRLHLGVEGSIKMGTCPNREEGG